MPRDLADVLHYFLPELEEPAPTTASDGDAAAEAGERSRAIAPASALPVLGLPVGDRDVVRAALAWNLAIETARLGASALLLAPASDRAAPLWPEPGVGPLGCELLLCPAKDLAGLYEAANALARQRAAGARHGGAVFLRIPPEWLHAEVAAPGHPRWHLLLSSARPADLQEAVGLGARIAATHPGSEIGLSVHGVTTIAEARVAFERASRRLLEQTGQELISYGLLVDDLHVYRAIAAQRPIGLAHPQSPAARALADVARLVYEDARSRVLG